MLLEQEQKYGNDFIQFYSQTPFKDEKKVNDFIYADDKGKQVMIKEFLNNVINPHNESELAVYQAKVSALSQSITSINSYAK